MREIEREHRELDIESERGERERETEREYVRYKLNQREEIIDRIKKYIYIKPKKILHVIFF